MRIILKGDAGNEEKILDKFRSLAGGDLRSFGYLLYELAGLKDLGAMNSRLDNIIARRKGDPKIDSIKLKEMLNNMVQDLSNNGSNSSYEKTTNPRKNSFNAWGWKPSNKDNAAVTYLRGLMRKLAAECISEAGGQP